MPTYEYRCKACGDHLEVVQSFKDEALTVCPACGGELRKVFGSIGITFKGSGFYRTDSRGSSSRPADGGAKTDSGSTTESSKTDTSSGKSDSGASSGKGDSGSSSKAAAS